MTNKRIALTTCGGADAAAELARALVERRLAACVNIIPGVRSFYWWDDAVQDDAEVLLLMKTDAETAPALEAAVRELHAYDTPEFVVLPVESGSAAYLEWIAANLG
ncbi:MAG: divalent cation tolerance protein CutA [Acidobacteria bacterium]|nr:divalent cation tolerance protein CutA [Acidobacteriota bacterium]